MAVPADKAALLAAIDSEYRKLCTELAGIASADSQRCELPGHAAGTQISVCNLLAYLVGWGELVLKWHARKQAGLAVDFPETGYRWNQLGPLAQKFYADYATADFDSLQAQLADVVGRIRQLIASYDDAALYGQPWYDKWPLGRMIQFNTSSPYSNARKRLRQWKKSLRGS